MRSRGRPGRARSLHSWGRLWAGGWAGRPSASLREGDAAARPGTARSPGLGTPEPALEKGKRDDGPLEGGVWVSSAPGECSRAWSVGAAPHCASCTPCPGKLHWVVEGMQGVCPRPPSVSGYEPRQGEGGPFGESTGLLASFPTLPSG